VITHSSTTRLTFDKSNSLRGRWARVALWVLQIALAAMFLFSGGSKLAGAPAMVALFDGIGWGQWFRYVTGTIELSAALALLIPSAAVFGAMLLIPTMIGAVAANLFLGQTPAPPLVLLVLASIVAWARRHELPMMG
jgi:putative oxidoreductase